MHLCVGYVIYRCWGWEKGSRRSIGPSEKGADCIKRGHVWNFWFMFFLFLCEV